jgi:alkanesulfonate monooxygenase SsuD/methylene tetrahydromethanopterin reductase-like flavin-dependent oxidoreductase (luciferase family)
MRYGIVLSTGTAREFAEAAAAAERAGWDYIFTFEAVWGQDAWVTLAAAAMVTDRIRLGTMLTPLPRRKPWEVAGQVATLDVLSGGRAQLAVGLGALHPNWTAFEADEGRRVRAEKLDEGLAVYDGLMRGQPFTFEGRHYRCTPTDVLVPPPPVQQPRVPVWVVGAYPAEASLTRAARWDGLLPAYVGDGPEAEHGADALAPVVERVRELREAAGLPWHGYDVIAEGTSTPDDAGAAHVRAYQEAGATVWVESDWAMGQHALERHNARIEAGPPAA